ncbi:hypothetical protein GCM10009128_16270 [Psychrosphaera haliotis]|uniref:rhodanese-like domain-containing protein n=1 Tax=Psychrosphaera haliotis TaxID=555083 RepID=UPI0031CFA95F
MKTSQELVAEVRKTINEISTSQLNELLHKEEVIVIDVREPGEFAAGHVPSSVNFPRGVLEMKIHTHPAVGYECDTETALKALAEKELYLICQSGGRSALSAESLQRLGFSKVTSVAGGMKDWKEQGLEVVQPS